ncbi:MAG TPA: polymer-forming cytoskeletal protein [Dehalococcoidia bacterium]|nr:polymer-forming cytoskeletal protein [Dehalococcoidia bacterium]
MLNQRGRMILTIALAVMALTLPLTQASAAGPSGDPADKFRGGNIVDIPAGETVPHDLYVSGGSVRIAGRVDGDLFVLGGTVDLSGPVTGDLFVAGGTVTISSAVDRHLRLLGGNATISGPVRQDLLAAAAGTLTLTPTAHVGGDLIFGAGRTEMDATVDGSVRGSAQSYVNNGRIGGSEQVTLRKEREQVQERRTPAMAHSLFDQVRRFVGIALAGALMIVLVPRLIRRSDALIRERPLPSFGIGAVAFISYFALMVALLVAMILVALPLGALGLGGLAATEVLGVLLGMGLLTYLFILVLVFVGAAVVGLAIGRLILIRVRVSLARNDYVPMLLGAVIVVVVTALPFIGGVANFVAILFGLGALAIALWPPRREAIT